MSQPPCFALALVADGAAALASLSDAERAAYGALRTEPRRRDWLAGRLAAKRAVAAALAIAGIERIELAEHAGAAPRPFLRATDGNYLSLPLALSIAHCDGRAAAVVGAEWVPIGVDLERRGSVAARCASYFLTPAERAQRCGLDATSLWALKEAAWKALRWGEDLPLSALELRLEDGGALRGVACCGAELAACAALAAPWPGYVLAVCSVEAPTAAVAR